MIRHELYNDNEHKWIYYGRDPNKGPNLIDTNQYLILNENQGLLVDPGGMEIFPSFIPALSGDIELENIMAIFASHQDPDIISSLSLWQDLCPDITVYVSWLWGLFIPHFGGGKAVTAIPDEGISISLGKIDLKTIPAHYMHSSGNFSLYDPEAKILFSGDIGAALLPPDHRDIFVDNFNTHIQYMEAFHKRWLPSNEAKVRWVHKARELNIDMLCPQHGCIFRGDQVKKFLDWLETLDVGQI
jgi:flavorubredoxin